MVKSVNVLMLWIMGQRRQRGLVIKIFGQNHVNGTEGLWFARRGRERNVGFVVCIAVSVEFHREMRDTLKCLVRV